MSHNNISRALKQRVKSLFDYFRKPSARRWLYGIVAILSVAFIGRAILTNWAMLSRQTWHLDWRFVVLSILLYPLGMLPTVIAWHMLLRSLNIPVSFLDNLHFYSLSILPRHIPGGVWYVSSRSMLYQDIGISGTRIVVATGIETILLSLTGAITSLLWFSLTKTVNERFRPLQIIALLAAIGIIVFLLWTPSFNRILQRIQRRWEFLQHIQIKQKEILISLLWMFVAWIGGGLLLFLLASGFLQINWQLLPNIIGVWGGSGAISLSLGALIQGMGLREITLGALLSTMMPLLDAAVIAIAFRLTLTAGEILWIPLFLWGAKKLSPGSQKNKEEHR